MMSADKVLNAAKLQKNLVFFEEELGTDVIDD